MGSFVHPSIHSSPEHLPCSRPSTQPKRYHYEQNKSIPDYNSVYNRSIYLALFIYQNRRRQWHPTPVLLPGKSHGRRSLAGCSPWGCKESDTTERLHFHALEKEMATHSSVLAWRIPGTGEPGGLPSMGSDRVGHD